MQNCPATLLQEINSMNSREIVFTSTDEQLLDRIKELYSEDKYWKDIESIEEIGAHTTKDYCTQYAMFEILS